MFKLILLSLVFVQGIYASDFGFQYNCHAARYVSHPWLSNSGEYVWVEDAERFDANLTFLQRDDELYGMIEIFKNQDRKNLQEAAANRGRMSEGETILFKPLTQSMVPAWRELSENRNYLIGRNKVGSPVGISILKRKLGLQELHISVNIETSPRTEDDVARGTSSVYACRKVGEFQL